MSEPITFTATVGQDGIIRLPEGIRPPPGEVRVTLTALAMETAESQKPERTAMDVVRGLAEFASKHHVPGSLPTDLAENHDHYLHGLPKGIDRQ